MLLKSKGARSQNRALTLVEVFIQLYLVKCTTLLAMLSLYDKKKNNILGYSFGADHGKSRDQVDGENEVAIENPCCS